MVTRQSPRQARLARELGSNIRRWRSVNGMSATDLAARAFITRDTLRSIETGVGSPRLDSVIAVLSVLGIAEAVIAAADPFTTEVGRARADEVLRRGGSL
jgi:transcriptional regulator with XRE-family HTH domain